MELAMIENMKDERYLISLLKHVFWAEPTQELLTQLLEGKTVEEVSDVDRGLNMLLKAVAANRDRIAAYAEDLAVEFTRLFIGPMKPPAVPFSSMYLDNTGALMTEITIDVRKRYLSAGMAVKDLYSLPDDHIAVELEFLNYLTEKCVDAFSAGDQETASRLFETMEEFTREHFSRWVPQFAQKVIDTAENDFYRGAGHILLAFARS